MSAKADALRFPGTGPGHRSQWYAILAAALVAVAVAVTMFVLTSRTTSTAPEHARPANGSQPVSGSTAVGVRPDSTVFLQAEDGIRGATVTGVQTCALPICHRLLGTGAGRGDDADPPGPYHVGEPQADPGEHGGSGAGSHDQPTPASRMLLERDLIGDRHVVTEQQDVQAEGERLVRLQRGELAWYRDHRDRGARRRPDGLIQRAGQPRRAAGPVLPCGEERPFTGPQRGVDDRVVVGAAGVGRTHREEEIAGPGGADLLPADTLFQQGLQVGRRGHRRGGPADPVGLLHRTGAGELQDRVHIGVGEEPHRDLHAAPRSTRRETIRVPAAGWPDSTAGARRGRAMTAHRPPASRNRKQARTLGPMLPSGNWPLRRCWRISSALTVPSGRCRGVPKSSITASTSVTRTSACAPMVVPSRAAARSLSMTASTPAGRPSRCATGIPPPPAATTMLPCSSRRVIARASRISTGAGEGTTRR